MKEHLLNFLVGGFILFVLILLGQWGIKNIMIFLIFAMIFTAWMTGAMIRDLFK